ncbi:MAG: flagellar filament capping protein FliD [Synergistaceae bacterium]|nr:flagellar filament capping protein FliD [Synergistaceae bacterium]
MAATFSIPGVVSGIDWGAMVDEIISKSQQAYLPMVTKRDNLERKISVYEEFNQSIRALQTKLTTLKLPSIYKAKTTEIARLDSNGLPQSVLTASVTSDAKIMNYDIEVIQKATTMSRYGKSLSGSEVGMDSVFYINVGGKRGKITVSATDTLEDIARKINNARDITTPTVPLDVVASVVNGQLVVRSTKTGAGSDGKLSDTIKRSNIGNDTLNFYPDLKNEIINGSVVIKGKDNSGVERTYQLGIDFDIVGNEIRWRDWDPKAVTAGSSYSLGYVPDPSDVLGYSVERARTGSEDPMHDSIFSEHTFMYDQYGNVVLPGSFEIEWNGTIYDENVDYKIEKDGIRWLGANRPPDYAVYDVKYTPAGGVADELWRFPAVTRIAADIPQYDSGYAEIISVSPSGNSTVTTNASAPTYSSYMKGNGTAVITQGIQTWVEGVDFDIVGDGTLGNQVSVRWKTEAGATAPEPGSSYDLKLVYTSTSGANTTTHTYTNRIVRNAEDEFEIDRSVIPFVDAPAGALDGKIYADNGLIYGESGFTFPGENVLEGSYTVNGVPDGPPWTSSTFTVTWTPPSAAPNLRPDVQARGQDYTIEYTGNMNMFSFDDNGDGILELLGFRGYSDPKDTEGQDAQIRINDGEIRTYNTNNIVFTESDTVFDDDGNIVSLLGLTLNVKGPGKVQLDVTQDAEKAVLALQEYIDLYNELMDWINIKMSEKAVDESQAATLSGDDFRMRWGLLHGDRLLSATKNKLRDITSFSQAIAFQSRTGRETLYGTLGDAGFKGEGFFTVRLGGAKSTITVDIRQPDGSLKKEEANIGGFAVQVFLSENDTLQNAAEKINEALKYNYTSEELGTPYYQTVPVYGTDGTTIIGYENKLITPSQEIVMGRAEVRNGKIVLTSSYNSPGSEIPLMVQDSSGILRYLGLNDRYTMLSQVGISTGASTGNIGTNAKTGFLEFDTDKFMEALTTDAEAVADLMVSNMNEMDKYLTSLSSSAQYEFAPGVVGMQGRVSSAIDQLRQEINGINKYLADADRRLEAKADSLYRTFSAAETALAKLSEQASWLATVTSALSGNNNNYS